MTNIAKACMDLAASSEPVHRRLRNLASTYPEKAFLYYRFNVERAMQNIGLQECKKMEEIGVHTDSYMGDVELEMNRCVQDLMAPPDIKCKYATSN